MAGGWLGSACTTCTASREVASCRSRSRPGREAVDALGQASYDLVLMDVRLREVDGYDATTAMREREQAGKAIHTPIIAMTANAMKGDHEKCLAVGMDGDVSKPVKRQALFAEIERVLDELT